MFDKLASSNLSIMETLYPDLPDIIFRKDVKELTKGAVSPRTLANHDSANTGPENRMKINGKVAYTRKDFLVWLSKHTTLINKSKKVSRVDEFLKC
jgi:hypothetical protein